MPDPGGCLFYHDENGVRELEAREVEEVVELAERLPVGAADLRRGEEDAAARRAWAAGGGRTNLTLHAASFESLSSEAGQHRDSGPNMPSAKPEERAPPARLVAPKAQAAPAELGGPPE